MSSFIFLTHECNFQLLEVVTNKANQDTFLSLKVKFLYHFHIPFFFRILKHEKVSYDMKKVSWLAIFTTAIIFDLLFLSLFLVKKDIIEIII